VDDDPDGKPEKVVEFAHPGRVALGQVVVDRDEVHTLAGQGVQDHRQGGHQGLAFTGFHLGDLALMQGDTADKLDIKMAHAKRAHRAFAHQGEDFGQHVVQGATVCRFLTQFHHPGTDGVVGQGLYARLEGVDGFDHGAQILEIALVARPDDLFGDGFEHSRDTPLWVGPGGIRQGTHDLPGLFRRSGCRRAVCGRRGVLCRALEPEISQ